MYVLEYAKNQLYIAGANTHMYLVKDWQLVQVIFDKEPANNFKTQAALLPGFDP